MGTCENGNHRPEVVTDVYGATWWRCLSCGEIRPAESKQGGIDNVRLC